MRRTITHGLVAAIVVAVTAAACGGGGGGSTPTTPTSPTTPTTPTTPSGGIATITIGADGRVTPTSVTIARGERVTFVNNHNTAHDMSSDPHPDHTQCPEMAQVGFLSPGQSRTSGNFNTARTCGFHDHIFFDSTALQGRIVIQ